MNRLEQIKNKAKEYAYNNYEQGGDSDTWEDIYTDGAGYGYQLAVEKAFEWLFQTMVENNWINGYTDIPMSFEDVEQFRKAMKGGKQ